MNKCISSSSVDPYKEMKGESDETFVKRRDTRDADVLCGRGNGVLLHPGNVVYMQLIKQYQKIYQATASHTEKKAIIERVIEAIEASDPPGRFLKIAKIDLSNLPGGYNEELFHVIRPKEVQLKVAQALREKTKPKKKSTKSQNKLALSLFEDEKTKAISTSPHYNEYRYMSSVSNVENNDISDSSNIIQQGNNIYTMNNQRGGRMFSFDEQETVDVAQTLLSLSRQDPK